MTKFRTHTFALTGPVDLVARIGHGSITVECRDDLTEATVTVTPRSADSDIAERTVVELRGRTLVVQAPRQGGVLDLPLLGGRGRQEAVEVIAVVPSGTPVRLAVADASVRVVGRCGAADVAGGSVDLVLEQVDGDLRLRFGRGTGRVDRVTGAAQARSGSGDVRFGEVGGDLTYGTGSGTVEVATARGAVRCRAGSGNAVLRAVYGDVDLASGSGALTIGVPAGVSARLEIVSGSGSVQSDLPIEDAPSAAARSITVRARTGSGPVSLRRAG